MEISAVIFSFVIVVLSVWIAYQWVVKPEREEQRRNAQRLHTEIRREREGRLVDKRKKSVRPTGATPTVNLRQQN